MSDLLRSIADCSALGTSRSLEVKLQAHANEQELNIYEVWSGHISFRCVLQSSSDSDLYIYSLTFNPLNVSKVKSLVLFSTNYGNFRINVEGTGEVSEYRLTPLISLAPLDTLFPMQMHLHNPHSHPIMISELELILYNTEDLKLLERVSLHVHLNSAMLGVKQSTDLTLFSAHTEQSQHKFNLQMHGHFLISIKSPLKEHSIHLSLPFIVTFLYNHHIYLYPSMDLYTSVTVPPGKGVVFERPIKIFHTYPDSLLVTSIRIIQESQSHSYDMARFFSIDHKPIYLPAKNSTAFTAFQAGNFKLVIPPDADLPPFNQMRIEVNHRLSLSCCSNVSGVDLTRSNKPVKA
ncbi:hypothetical protein Ciccas_004434 [Cichlidogyrus casuarinus]|uniref:Uncharacterized protein n=1 Tax=Cichlidogyrus casuarinus TaxID=1844966 RepID=A0ABD2QBL9_9PLAT